MNIAPIDFGPPVREDTSGLAAQQEAIAQREKVFGGLKELGDNTQHGGLVIAQGLLHNQVAKATADTKEVQAKTLEFIDRNRYVAKSDLQSMMSKEDYEKWANKNQIYNDADTVPMYSVAGNLYDSVMRKTLADKGQSISLPGWREAWDSTSRTEISTIRERYVNRIAADQMIADNRAVAHDNFQRLLNSATTEKDIKEAKAVAQGTPWFSPGERELLGRTADARKDTLAADNALAMNNGLGDLPAMKTELARLSGPDAAKNYPNITEQQRLTLQRRLETQVKTAETQSDVDSGLQWARDVVAGLQLKNSSMVDRDEMNKQFALLKGNPAKLKTAEAEMNRLAEEGQRAQEDKEGRAFTQGVVNVERTGDMGAAVRAVLSNPNGTRSAGTYYERLLTIAKMRDKNDPTVALEHAQAWMFARSALQQTRTTGMTFEQFIGTQVNKEGDTIGTTVDPKQLKPLQALFIAAQQTEKKNDEHPLSGEVLQQIRLTMKDAYGTDPAKTLTADELALHANIERHVLERRNAVQDTGGQVKSTDYASWISEYVKKDPELRIALPWTWGRPWATKSQAERPPPAERPDLYKTINGETRFYNGTKWVP
jgi:hypothetical protein